MLLSLCLLPVVIFALLVYQLRPYRAVRFSGTPAGGGGDPLVPVVGPARLAVVRAAVVLGALAAGMVEVLSAFHALTAGWFRVIWVLGTVIALAGAWRRYRIDRAAARPGGWPGWRVTARLVIERARATWSDAGWTERIMGIVLSLALLSELVIALVSPPNNYDSQTYHLPKIEHWVAQHDVAFFATNIHRQVTLAPGAEYLLLHLRMFTGGDALYNLLQYAAGIGCALIASRIAGQLGGSARAQMIAAFVVSTTPTIALESTSTQTDLVVALWVACVATLVLDELRRRTPPGAVVLMGAAAGLTTLTKATGLLAAAPLLLLWLVTQLRRKVAQALVGGFVIVGLTAALAGPFLVRVDRAFGNPLGPPYLRGSISMQRHDPASVLVNAMRIGESAIEVPVQWVDTRMAHAVLHASQILGVNPNDQLITFWGSTYPSKTWVPDEDYQSLPASAILIVIGAAVLLIRRRYRNNAVPGWIIRWYVVVFWLALLIHVTTVKWQPWGNRLLLYLVALGAPLAGLWLDGVLAFRTRRVEQPAPSDGGVWDAGPARPVSPLWGGVLHAPAKQVTLADPVPATSVEVRHSPAPRRQWLAAGVVLLVLASGAVAAGSAITAGSPRGLFGDRSVFGRNAMQIRFTKRAGWLGPYVWAARAVRASGAHRVGVVEGSDSWEYPWWLLLRGDQIVALQSVVPTRPPADPGSVDAIVCSQSPSACAYYVPKGWTLEMRGNIGYALPPGR